MIKIWPDSLDENTSKPMGSFLFAKDLCLFGGCFEISSGIESADCIIIPQFSNNGIVPYKFDKAKADLISSLKKPIVLQNDAGGEMKWWQESDIGKYIWGEFSELIKVFFSVECYDWHRKVLPPKIKYVPFDFVGYSDNCLWMNDVPPVQTKQDFLARMWDTFLSQNTYPPTRDRLWQMLNEPHSWQSFSHNTNPTYPPFREKISWQQMKDGLCSTKIGFSPDAATSKSERHTFVPLYTAMMMQDDTVEFPFKWVDGENCMKMRHDLIDNENAHRNGHDIRVLNKEKTKKMVEFWLSNPTMLYQIYLNGRQNAEKYLIPNYFKNHIGKTIKENL